jgi:hypothetical protein
MKTIDEKVECLLSLGSGFIFPEYYSHTHCMMWKIKNTYTDYKEEKFVLYSVD